MKRIIMTVLLTMSLLFTILGTPALAQGPGDVIINEIMQNPSAVYDSAGEWFELYNPNAQAIDIDGWTIQDNDVDSHIIDNGGPLVIPAGGYLVLGINGDSATNGGVSVDYQYPSDFFLGNSSDELVLLDDSLVEIDRVEYDNGATFPDPTGRSMALRDPSLDNSIGAHWYTSSTPYGDGDSGTPGVINDFPYDAPTATTGAATEVGTSSATLNGTVNANGYSTTVTFEYGLTTAYGTTMTAIPSLVTGSTYTAVSASILSLTPNTTYHYRVVATNAGGTVYGADMTFNTKSGKPASGKAYGKDHAPGQNKDPGEPADGKGYAPGQNKESGEPADGKAYGKDHAPGQNKESGEKAEGKGVNK
ncbi:MAG: lamin tail domain-containing protein [Dehalococcoidia bacterium]|nr:MAG: lamin tail domain-containing protein [Dehalococcoidia bacterium]